MRNRRCFLLAVIMTAQCFAFCTAGAGPSLVEIQRNLLSNVRGMTVENNDAEVLGQMSDFLIDLGSGHVRYALVSVGGFHGLRPVRRIVPIQALSNATAKKNTLALDIGTASWKKAPRFLKTDLTSLSQNRAAQLARFYGLSLGQNGGAAAVTNGRIPTATGPEIPSAVNGSLVVRPLKLTRDLIGRHVVTWDDKPAGTVSDLLIDLSGRRPPFVISTSRTLFKRETRYALPLGLLSLSGENLRIKSRHPISASAPFLTDEVWNGEDTLNSIIFRYGEKAAR